MQLKCVLFDFDGVIVDTEPHNADNLAKGLAHFGVVMTDEEKKAQVGKNDRDAMLQILSRAKVKVTMEDLSAYRDKIGTYYETGEDFEAQPGFRAALAEIRSAGLRTAVVSSTRSKLILTALNRLGLLSSFDTVVCGDMVEKHKPDPECYFKAMEWLGAKPSECLIVEDSPYGIHAGKAAGATVVAYTGSSYEQDTHEADFTIAHFNELPKLILSSFQTPQRPL